MPPSLTVHDITAYGAKGDGATVNTQAINEAVRKCAGSGGGTVYVPSGRFVTGTIRLLSNVNLHLETGALLEGSPNIKDYMIGGRTFGVIVADSAHDVAITGLGSISGNGMHFHSYKPHVPADFDRSFTRQGAGYLTSPYALTDGPLNFDERPGMMVVFLRCENITLRDVTLRDSPEWTLRFASCENVTVSGIDILNDLLIPNNDGIHCTTSRNIRISDCNIVAGDDAIIVTGFDDQFDSHGGFETPGPEGWPYGNKTGASENVVVTNCTVSSRSAGFRVGYGRNDIRNCLFQNCTISNSNRGIGVFTRDPGSIENCIFSNITIETGHYFGQWWGKAEPIHVSAIRQNASVGIGRIRNIVFENIIAKSESGVVLYGTPESVLEEVHLRDIRLHIVDGPKSAAFGGNFDLRPCAYMDRSIFKHDIPGIYAGHVKDLAIRDVKLTWGENLQPYFSHGIEYEDCAGVMIRDFDGR